MNIKQIIKKVILYFGALPAYVRLKLRTTYLGYDLHLRGGVSLFGNGEIYIGNHVTINSGHMANPSGGVKTAFYVLPNAKLSIGDFSGLSNTTICCANKVEIGAHVTIGAGTSIYDTDFHPLDYLERRNNDSNIKTRPVIIDDDAFIGAYSIILKGSKIGKRSIVGAGSVVSGVIRDDEIWAGNPAKFIRKIDSPS